MRKEYLKLLSLFVVVFVSVFWFAYAYDGVAPGSVEQISSDTVGTLIIPRNVVTYVNGMLITSGSSEQIVASDTTTFADAKRTLDTIEQYGGYIGNGAITFKSDEATYSYTPSKDSNDNFRFNVKESKSLWETSKEYATGLVNSAREYCGGSQ